MCGIFLTVQSFICDAARNTFRLVNISIYEHTISFNAKKSKFMEFCRNMIRTNNMLSMPNGSLSHYVEQGTYLLVGTIIYSDITHKSFTTAINDLFLRTNSLVAEFSFIHNTTLHESVLYEFIFVNVYGSQHWLCITILYHLERKYLKKFAY